MLGETGPFKQLVGLSCVFDLWFCSHIHSISSSVFHTVDVQYLDLLNILLMAELLHQLVGSLTHYL